MASRTKQKEEARARRLAEERARAERARRDRRLRMIGGIVLGAIILVGVAIAISSHGGGRKETGLQTGTNASATVAGISSLLSGIPQSGATLGNPKAPVTMDYYGDFECPICQEFTLAGGFPQLVANDVRSGKVKVVYKAFCTATCSGPGPQVFTTQQVAGLAAGKQNRFWQYAELFYHEQGQEDTGYVNENYLTGLASQIPGLNVATWKNDRNDPALTAQVQGDQNDGKTIGVDGTPTLVFSGPKGQTGVTGVPTYAQLEQAIQQVT